MAKAKIFLVEACAPVRDGRHRSGRGKAPWGPEEASS